MRRIAVERRFPSGSVAKLGTLYETDNGWRFNPAVSGKRPSLKDHSTWEQALPKWAGYPDRCETREL